MNILNQLANLYFIRPYFFLLLLPLLFWFIRVITASSMSSAWKNIFDQELLNALLKKQNLSVRQQSIIVVLGLALIFSIVALAGPSITPRNQHAYKMARSMVLVLDLSSQMQQQDLLPSRWQRALYKIRDLLAQLKDTEIGWVVFSNEAFLVSPLTSDKNNLLSWLEEVNPDVLPVSGQSLRSGVKQALDLLMQRHIHEGEIVLLTNGSVTEKDLQLAEKVRAQGQHLSVWMIQKPGVKIAESEALATLAKQGGGRFIPLTENDEDVRVFAIPSLLALQNQEVRQTLSMGEDQGYWIVLMLLPVLLMMFRRGWFAGVTE